MPKIVTRKDLITRDKNIMGGIPCIKGTRIPVEHVRSLKNSGVSARNIKNLHYPVLSESQIKEILNLFN